ncbi:hypothetical protein AB833_14300 [Chromatiales bacterium (ex Bugula neritina AB1)]|nr:hypothetical protein AB833_14300 [Chromatiales bacterium (ex Bugula neritina AB1)]
MVKLNSGYSTLEYLRTDDGSLTLRDTIKNETFHSKFGALAESRSVFLENSGVLGRLRRNQPTRIFEIGFGTGMNFMLTALAAREHCCSINYVAVENQLLPDEFISTILKDTFPCGDKSIEATETAISQLRQKPSAASDRETGDHRSDSEGCTPVCYNINEYTRLTLLIQDAQQTRLPEQSIDAIYLDAFSSKNNPQLWTQEHLKQLHSLLSDGGVLATYSVNRQFREALTASGFQWHKHRGPRGKREVLTAQRAQ